MSEFQLKFENVLLNSVKTAEVSCEYVGKFIEIDGVKNVIHKIAYINSHDNYSMPIFFKYITYVKEEDRSHLHYLIIKDRLTYGHLKTYEDDNVEDYENPDDYPFLTWNYPFKCGIVIREEEKGEGERGEKGEKGEKGGEEEEEDNINIVSYTKNKDGYTVKTK